MEKQKDEIELGVKCSEIKSEKELEFIEGYQWSSNKLTKENFEAAKLNDIGFKVGAINLDLIDMESLEIIDTITLDKDFYYNELTTRN